MKKTLLLCLFLLLIPLTAKAQKTLQDAATSTGAGSDLEINVGAQQTNGVIAQVSGTFSGTITWRGTLDGTHFDDVSCTNLTTLITATTATATGLYSCALPRISKFRAHITARDSGSITVVAAAAVGVARNSSGVSGSFTSGQVAIANGASSLTGDSDFTFATDTVTVTKAVIGGGSAITSSGPGGALTALGFTSPGTGVATALGANVGSAGAFVVNGGAGGTPSSLTLTNATGLPVGGISGLGTGVATFLATPSSANLAAAVTDETGSGAAVFADSPTFTTGVTSPSYTITGNISQAAWTTSGIRIKGVASTLTDTTSSGTVAAAYTNVLGGNTIAASSATTFTNYFTTYMNDPVAGTNVTLTNKWALGGDSLKIGTSNPLTVSNAGVLNATSPVFVTPTLGAATATTINGNTFTAGTYTLTGTAAKTLNFTNSLTLSGTDGSTLNVGTGGTLGTGAFQPTGATRALDNLASVAINTDLLPASTQGLGNASFPFLASFIGNTTQYESVSQSAGVVIHAGLGSATDVGFRFTAKGDGSFRTVSTGSAGTRGIIAGQYNSGAQGSFIVFEKARGSFASPSAITTGDYVGLFGSQGYDGSQYTQSAYFGLKSYGTIGSNSVPQRFIVTTTSGGSAAYNASEINLVLDSASLRLQSTGVFGFSSSGSDTTAAADSAFSRISAGLIGVGTGAQGSFAGSLKATNGTFVGTVDVPTITSATSITGGAGNMTITAGTGNSRTMALQTTTSGGVTTAFLTGNADQSATFANNITIGTNSNLFFGSSSNSLNNVNGRIAIIASNGTPVAWNNTRMIVGSTTVINFGDAADPSSSGINSTIRGIGAANIGIGAAPSATPAGNIFTIGESSRVGTDSNVAGASGTIQSGTGTGTGAVATLIFQTPTLGSSGTTAQSYATRLTLSSAGATFAVPILASAGGSASSVKAGGALFDHYADVSTTHTDGTEDDLYSDSVPASTLDTNGHKLRSVTYVNFVSSATASRRLKAYFGGTNIFDSGALTLSLGGDFWVEMLLIRESSTVVRAVVTVTTTSASSVPYVTYTRITGLTLTNANTLKTTGIAAGTGAASGDIAVKSGFVEFLPAQ